MCWNFRRTYTFKDTFKKKFKWFETNLKEKNSKIKELQDEIHALSIKHSEEINVENESSFPSKKDHLPVKIKKAEEQQVKAGKVGTDITRSDLNKIKKIYEEKNKRLFLFFEERTLYDSDGHSKRPDFIVLCEEGIFLIETKFWEGLIINDYTKEDIKEPLFQMLPKSILDYCNKIADFNNKKNNSYRRDIVPMFTFVIKSKRRTENTTIVEINHYPCGETKHSTPQKQVDRYSILLKENLRKENLFPKNSRIEGFTYFCYRKNNPNEIQIQNEVVSGLKSESKFFKSYDDLENFFLNNSINEASVKNKDFFIKENFDKIQKFLESLPSPSDNY